MTDWETINSVVRGAEWVAAGGVLGYTFLYSLPLLSDISPFNKKIKSKEELERVVRERAPKLGLNPSNIDVIYCLDEQTYADTKGGREILSLGKGFGCRVNSVDHELCHIANRDCDREKSKDWYYYFVAEPRAVLYEVFGLKVGWKK